MTESPQEMEASLWRIINNQTCFAFVLHGAALKHVLSELQRLREQNRALEDEMDTFNERFNSNDRMIEEFNAMCRKLAAEKKELVEALQRIRDGCGVEGVYSNNYAHRIASDALARVEEKP